MVISYGCTQLCPAIQYYRQPPCVVQVVRQV